MQFDPFESDHVYAATNYRTKTHTTYSLVIEGNGMQSKELVIYS